MLFYCTVKKKELSHELYGVIHIWLDWIDQGQKRTKAGILNLSKMSLIYNRVNLQDALKGTVGNSVRLFIFTYLERDDKK
jgi:hypothetical protein